MSTSDTAWLRLANFDPIAHTVDVLMKNPTSRIMGYEFTLQGLTIQNVTNLVPNMVNDISVNSSLGGQRVIGLSYIDSSIVKSQTFQPLCRIHYFSLTAPQLCISAITDIVNKDANNVVTYIDNGCLTVPNTVVVSLKAVLEGPFQSGMMRDDLRAAGLLPVGEPFTALNFTHAGGGGGEAVLPSVFDVVGNDAIVDWVLVELRQNGTPSNVIATRSALLQRDGDVVGLDGVSPVLLQAPAGTYHIALRHRNHLGLMTAVALPLSSSSTTVDLTLASAAVYGSNARKDLGAGVWGLWAGNTFNDDRIKYTGVSNDRDPILFVVGGTVPTNIVLGYYREDTNLSGTVKYTGALNDRDPILNNIGGITPTATRIEQLP